MQYANETRASNDWAYNISTTAKAKTKTIASNHLSTPAMRTFVGRNTTASNWMAVSVTLTLLLPPSLLNNSRVSFLFTSFFFLLRCFFPRFVLFVRSFASLIFFHSSTWLSSLFMCIWCRFTVRARNNGAIICTYSFLSDAQHCELMQCTRVCNVHTFSNRILQRHFHHRGKYTFLMHNKNKRKRQLAIVWLVKMESF